MSGDVQPRKRKDKKKKRESLDVRRSEGELIFSRKSSLQDDEASHGVHVTKMGSDDVLLHVHEEHGTGGHWCAKIIFFSLMAILLGLVGLIILENRGLSDVDTPLSESRFSNYFDGWVDEHRADHDDHHDSHDSLEHDDHEADEDEDDDHDEPFEEEADHSEGDDEELAEEEDDNVTPEEEEEDVAENVTAEEEDDEEDDADDEEEDTVTAEIDDNVTAEEGDEENATGEDDNGTKEITKEQNEDVEDDEDDDEDDEAEDEEDNNVTKDTSKPASQAAADNDDDDDDDGEDPYDEDDDDGTFDSLEKIVDNDAAELELLQEKARQQAAESKLNTASAENDVEDEADSAPNWASSQIKPKTGGGPQSLEDADDDVDLFEQELRRANEEMMQERYVDALTSFERLIQKYPNEPRLYLGKAVTYDHYAERHQSNRLLMKAIEAYKQYLEFDIKDQNQLRDYRMAAEHCLERMRFLGQFQQALPIYKRMIGKFPQKISLHNDLAVTYLMLDRLSDAKQVLAGVLQQWPEDGFALVHYGFVVKQLDNDYHEAAIYLRKGIESKALGTQEGRFYFHLGETLQRLGRQDEARQIFRQGADLKFYPSVYQRSLYNEGNLKAQPFWSLEETPYAKYLKNLQDNWLAIKAEGLNALSKTGYFLDESENLKNKGDWKEFELFRRGQQRRDNCLKAPITCNLINQFPAARDCKRGQVKFSVMQPGTHVWPHCGPTNCRLRAHLGLVVPNGTRLRVADEERSWQEGKFLIFDDSFEHEVWHEGQSFRLVLIVDIWHPDLTEQQRLSLNPI